MSRAYLLTIFIGLLPQFLRPGARTLQLGPGFTAVTFLTLLGYAVLAAGGRQRVLPSHMALTWLPRAFAAPGLKLAMGRA